MRDTARLQVIALALLGAFAWISMDMLDVRSALAGLMPAASHAVPAVTPIHDPIVPRLGDETLAPKAEPHPLPRPLLRPAHRHEFWIVTSPPEAFVG